MSAAAGPRRALLAKLHLAKKALSLDDDTYRSVLARTAGVSSAADANIHQLELALAEMRRLGFVEQKRPRAARNPQARMIWGLWSQLHREGGLRSDDLSKSLRAFVERMTQVTDPDWLTAEQSNVVVEGIKAMLKRAKGKPA